MPSYTFSRDLAHTIIKTVRDVQSRVRRLESYMRRGRGADSSAWVQLCYLDADLAAGEFGWASPAKQRQVDVIPQAEPAEVKKLWVGNATGQELKAMVLSEARRYPRCRDYFCWPHEVGDCIVEPDRGTGAQTTPSNIIAAQGIDPTDPAGGSEIASVVMPTAVEDQLNTQLNIDVEWQWDGVQGGNREAAIAVSLFINGSFARTWPGGEVTNDTLQGTVNAGWAVVLGPGDSMQLRAYNARDGVLTVFAGSGFNYLWVVDLVGDGDWGQFSDVIAVQTPIVAGTPTDIGTGTHVAQFTTAGTQTDPYDIDLNIDGAAVKTSVPGATDFAFIYSLFVNGVFVRQWGGYEIHPATDPTLNVGYAFQIAGNQTFELRAYPGGGTDQDLIVPSGFTGIFLTEKP